LPGALGPPPGADEGYLHIASKTGRDVMGGLEGASHVQEHVFYGGTLTEVIAFQAVHQGAALESHTIAYCVHPPVRP